MSASTPAPSRTAPSARVSRLFIPDVVLISQDRGRKVMAVIEVETVESVNNLEALAEWVPYGRLKFPFHLYVPAAMVDVAKRLCTDSHIPVAEIHTYHWIGDEMRFLPAYKAPADGRTAAARPAAAKPASPKAKPKAKPARKKPAPKPARKTGRSPKRK